MSCTYEQAVDEMFALPTAAWDAGAAAIVGTGKLEAMRYDGVELSNAPATDCFWARLSEQLVTEPQSTFRTGVAPDEQKRYSPVGVMFAQLFCPTADAQAKDKGRKLAVLLRNSVRGKTTASGVWFRNARIQTLAPENEFIRFNIVVDFTYDDIG